MLFQAPGQEGQPGMQTFASWCGYFISLPADSSWNPPGPAQFCANIFKGEVEYITRN